MPISQTEGYFEKFLHVKFRDVKFFMEQIRYRLILQNIIFCILKSFIFFVKQAFTLSLKHVKKNKRERGGGDITPLSLKVFITQFTLLF